ncbi:dTDP-3,4-didehydro-2,6-dideoxy-alpha-D-glucose 3-reductase [Burkholderiaceae bacterium]|nr:dTDP-3,4-didehydro-2,6-dideoxy-alpha-D-glucose 3-reductase [Burkholderiaceae bacterium]
MLAEEGRVALAGLVVASDARAKTLASSADVPVHVGFRPELLDGVDAVDIATPAATHDELVAACLPHVHVLVEKPLAGDAAAARRLHALAHQHGRVLMTGHVYHHHPLTVLLRETLAQIEEAPQTLELTFTNPPDARSQALDPFAEWLHVFDLLRICAPAAVSTCNAWRDGEMAHASVSTRDGTRAQLHFGWRGPEPIRRLKLAYGDRHVSADFLDGNLTLQWRERTEKQWVGVRPVALRRELAHFLDVLARRSEPMPSPAQVEATLALAARARDSARGGATATARPRGSRSSRPRVAVLGGGVFGATCAIELGASCDVTLFERHSALLTEASYLNQWRHHSGFHYPRSLETIQEVQRTKADFESVYEPAILRDIDAYYAVSAWGSEITAQRYVATCQANGLRYREIAPPRDIVYPERLSVCLHTDEAVVEIGKLGKLLMKSLRGHRHVDLRLSTEVKSGRLLPDGRKQLAVAGERPLEPYDFLINATYANSNRVTSWFGFPLRPLRFDLLEMAVVEIPKARRFMMTILDAPFTSLTSVGSGDLFMLSHIHQSILASQVPPDGLPPKWKSWSSNRDNLMRHGLRYLPILERARHVESRVGVRTVEAYSEDYDGRPTVLTPHGFGCWSVLGGKIVTAVSNARELAAQIERESAALRA